MLSEPTLQLRVFMKPPNATHMPGPSCLPKRSRLVALRFVQVANNTLDPSMGQAVGSDHLPRPYFAGRNHLFLCWGFWFSQELGGTCQRRSCISGPPASHSAHRRRSRAHALHRTLTNVLGGRPERLGWATRTSRVDDPNVSGGRPERLGWTTRTSWVGDPNVSGGRPERLGWTTRTSRGSAKIPPFVTRTALDHQRAIARP